MHFRSLVIAFSSLTFIVSNHQALTSTPEPKLPRIHRYSSGAGGIFANAYLVETANGVVAIDATLSVSDSRAFRAMVDSLHKPLLAVLLTHGHPDHYNGVTTLVGSDSTIPIVATAGVDSVIRANDAAKEKQWRPVFKDEWPARRTFPSRVARDTATFVFDGVSFSVRSLGPGESHSDSYWIMRGPRPVAFIGDEVLNHVHAYLSDGHSRAWLHNLDRLKRELWGANVAAVYPGHGEPGSLSMLDWQRQYLTTYRDAVRELAHGRSKLTEAQKKELTARMRAFLPTDRLEFLIPLGADPVAAELAR
jgi:glyoxylase-like metal-dependent hydrolase (beta-lactamase superfamily II)